VCGHLSPRETFTDAPDVHHRAQRVVPDWSPSKRPKGLDETQLFVGDNLNNDRFWVLSGAN
jgi:hypothetical protein